MINHFDTQPSGDDMKLAGEVAKLARTGFGGSDLIYKTVSGALALTRVHMAEAIKEELTKLTPLEFHGTWLDQQSVDEAIDRALERESW